MGAFFMPTAASMKTPDSSNTAMLAQTATKNRLSTPAISGNRDGGCSCATATGRSAPRMKVMPPSQTMAAAA